ncbi:uncharacterized protein LOC136715939 [Amia ocellicauda]|uniref:uncharacterized protein LOC136715939 n=1 Tax=Amia ocellicauda TaxID=2972642 RepID=UPI0034647D67
MTESHTDAAQPAPLCRRHSIARGKHQQQIRSTTTAVTATPDINPPARPLPSLSAPPQPAEAAARQPETEESFASEHCLAVVLEDTVLGRSQLKALAPTPRYGAALLAVVLYSVGKTLYSFLTRLFVTQYHYRGLVQLAFAQMLLTLLAAVALQTLGAVSLQPFSLRRGEQLLVPAVGSGVQAVLGLWAEVNAPGGLFSLTQLLLPLACVGCSHALALTRTPSQHCTALLAGWTLVPLLITVLQVSLWAEPLVVLYSALSVLLHSLSLGWLAKVGEQQQCEPDGRASALDLHFTLCVDSSLALGLLCLLLPGGLSELGQGSWHSLLFLGYLLGVLALGALQSLLLSLVALCCSPVAAGVLHTALDLTLPLRSLL